MRTNTTYRSLALISLAAMGVAAQAQQTVYSNGAGGDNFTNGTGSAANSPITGYTGPQGQVFSYRETKNNGSVGINGNYARSGNGSAWINANGTDSKSELAMAAGFSAAGDSTGSLGSLDSLTAWSADLLTVSSSIGNEAPIARLEVGSVTDATYGSLVFDTAWTPGHQTFTYGTWQNFDFFAHANSTWVRATSSLAAKYGTGNNELLLSDWLTMLHGKDYGVLSANFGIGQIAGAGTFEGAVDNLRLGIGGHDNTFNFETPVPEPTTIAAVGLGLIAVVRRRKKA